MNTGLQNNQNTKEKRKITSVIFQFAAAPTLRSDTHLSSAKHQLGSGSGPGVGGRAVGVSAIGCLLCGSEIGVRTLVAGG